MIFSKPKFWDDKQPSIWSIILYPFSIIYLLITIINTTLAQNILCRFGYAIRPRPSYSSFNLPGWMSIALAISILSSLIPGLLGDVGRNAAPLLSTPFFLLGLAVIHNLSHRVALRGAVLAGVYIPVSYTHLTLPTKA